MNKIYGNLVNRIEEGRLVDTITIGMPITMYHWSDRTCYYVTEVISQTHIKVKRYYVVADRDLPGGQGHQNWKFFKTKKEENDYMKKYFPDQYDDLPEDYKEPEAEDWVFKYGKWKSMREYTPEDLNATNQFGVPFRNFLFTDNEIKKLESGKNVRKYSNLSGAISFGVRDYYYDWCF